MPELESLAEYLLAVSDCTRDDPHGIHESDNGGICLGKGGAMVASGGWQVPAVPQEKLEIVRNGETFTQRVARIQHDHNISEKEAVRVAKSEINIEEAVRVQRRSSVQANHEGQLGADL